MAGKEQFLSQKYEKWSKFEIDSDSDDEGAAVPRVPTQFDVEGDADIVVSTELLLTQAQVERYKKLEKKQLEVWQIVVRKLRVWSASSSGADDGDNAVPCRPYCILVNNLYPLGQVVSKKICDPPEVYPSPKTVLDLTLHAMIEPPSNTPQHRPDKIVFPDKNFVGQLRKSYAALNIECSYLSESEGIDAYIQELSNHLVRNDLASVAEVSSRPGMKTGSGITTELLRGFYAACAEYAELEPWNKLAERQALQVDAVGDDELRIDKRHHVGRGTIFTSVIGTKTADAHIRGLALFYTRADLERRVLPRGEKLALLENPELRRCAFCDKKAAPGKELKRCTRCKSTFYCGAACQRGHWPDHKISCMPADSATTAGGPIKWGVKEISILYGPLTSVPFDDLDDIDKHGFAIANLRGEKMYPSAVVFRKGEPDVADATELVWLTRALNAQIGLLKKHPLFMQETMIDLLGLEEVDGEDRQRKVELQVSTLGNDDYLVIRNSTVLTMDDVERLRAAVKRHEAAAPASGEDESPAPVTSSEAAVDAAEAKPRASSASVDEDENDDEGKACSVM